MAGVEGRPKLDPKDLPSLLKQFGLVGEDFEFKELPAFDDCSLLVTTQGQRYVLKAHNALLTAGSRQRLEAQDRVIQRLHDRGL
ncbi:unnamed protein product, partial [Polarella glacialis]